MTTWLLRCLLALCCLGCGAGPAAAAEPARVRQNFNAGWHFQLGDPAGAEAPGFDDGPWERVGLPHSFGIPYFQSPTFHVGHGWYRKALVIDGDPGTFWLPAPDDADPWVSVDPERVLAATRLVVTLRAPGRYAVHAELQAPDGHWAVLVDEPVRELPQATVELPTHSLVGRKLRLRVRAPGGEPVGVAEMRIVGRLKRQ